jgi:16S rRNA (cytidine1402-2'-O)-methyltransferase
MSGTLFVVATPIGNLEDITLRALRIMREADLIAAEDTRRTAKLLAHYTISTPTISFHEHNSRTRVPQLLARLEGGASVALVSDAGTPGIADPGIALVRACWQRSIPIDPVPGACASLTAAVASGFPLEPLTIFGFVPARSKDRSKWLERLQGIESTVAFFETPHRIQKTLAELHKYFGNRPICVARELTKVHQELIVGDSLSVVGQMTSNKGEFTVIIGPLSPPEPPGGSLSDRELYDEFCHMAKLSPSRRMAVAALATKYGRTPKSVYSAIERLRSDAR